MSSAALQVKQFRKKPIMISAAQWDGSDDLYEHLKEWSKGVIARQSRNVLEITTLEGTMEVKINDWVIRGVAGEFYPCKPEIFEKTYEEIK